MEAFIWFLIILAVGGGILGGVLNAVVMTKREKKSKTISNNIMTSQGYTVTGEIGDLLIDDIHHKWTVSGHTRIFDYSDIIDISETQNGTKTKISGGIGAGVGLGNVGVGISSSKAVSTTISSWTIDITVRNSSSPLVQIVLFSGTPIKVGSFAYNATNLLRERYIAQLKQIKDAGSRVMETPTYSVNSAFDTKVVGVTKNNDKGQPIQALLPSLNEDSDFMLVREPNNPYDTNAIKVIADYQHIGYVKAELAQQLAPIMDKGNNPKVELLGVTGGGDKNYGCNIRILI